MSKKILIVARRLLFVACVCALGMVIARVLAHKSPYLSMVKTFEEEPRHTYDVVAVGSSHMYCTLVPSELYRNYNVKAFCLATQRQPIEASYTYLKKAIALQKPKVVILEMIMFVKREDGYAIEEGIAHDAFDPMCFDWNKVELLLNTNVEGSIEDYVLPFLKYHSRWKELKKKDFNFSFDRNVTKGYALLARKKKSNVSQKDFQNVKFVPLADNALHWLEKTVSLARSSGAQVVLLFAPCSISMKDAGRIRHINEFAKENGLPFLNLLEHFDEIGFDRENDFYDTGHLNVFGADKATKYIGKYLRDHCRIEPAKLDDAQKAQWEDDVAQYDIKRKDAVASSQARAKAKTVQRK